MEINMKEFEALMEAYGHAAISHCSLHSKVALKAAFDLRNFVQALSPPQTRPQADSACANQQAVARCSCEIASDASICEQGFAPHPYMQEACSNSVGKLLCGHESACHQQPREG